MKASELKAGTLYASTSYGRAGVLLSNDAIYGTARSTLGGGLRVSAGKNYAVLTIAELGHRFTIQQLQAAAEGFTPGKPAEIGATSAPEGTSIEFWPSRKFDGEYEAVQARKAATYKASEEARQAREEKFRQEREDREATSARLTALLPDAAQLYESGSGHRASIALKDLKALLTLAEGKK